MGIARNSFLNTIKSPIGVALTPVYLAEAFLGDNRRIFITKLLSVCQ